jgi:hypothetical protein
LRSSSSAQWSRRNVVATIAGACAATFASQLPENYLTPSERRIARPKRQTRCLGRVAGRDGLLRDAESRDGEVRRDRRGGRGGSSSDAACTVLCASYLHAGTMIWTASGLSNRRELAGRREGSVLRRPSEERVRRGRRARS